MQAQKIVYIASEISQITALWYLKPWGEPLLIFSSAEYSGGEIAKPLEEIYDFYDFGSFVWMIFCYRQKFPMQVDRLWDGRNSLFMGCNSFAVKIAYFYAETAEVFGNILCIFPSNKLIYPSTLNGFKVGSHIFSRLSSQQRNAIFWPMQRINAKSNKSQSMSNEESLAQH